MLASYHWLDGKHRVLVSDGLRTPLPMRIASGEEGGVVLRVQAPDTPGRAVLAIDFVHENVTWFSEQGVTPCEVESCQRARGGAEGAEGDERRNDPSRSLLCL